MPVETFAALTFDKSDAVGTRFVDNDEDGHADVGDDLIQFVLQIQNTGNVTLHGLAINDPLLGGAIGGMPATLVPGATFNLAIDHFLTQAEVDAGHVLNTGTASGLDPSNTLVSVMAFYDQLLPA